MERGGRRNRRPPQRLDRTGNASRRKAARSG